MLSKCLFTSRILQIAVISGILKYRISITLDIFVAKTSIPIFEFISHKLKIIVKNNSRVMRFP